MKTDPWGESMVKCCDSRINTTSSPVSCNPLLWWWKESKGCTCRIGDPQWILQWDKVNFWQVSTGLHFAPLHILYHCNMECCFHLFFPDLRWFWRCLWVNVVAHGYSILKVSILGLPWEVLAQYEQRLCIRRGSAKYGAVLFLSEVRWN